MVNIWDLVLIGIWAPFLFWIGKKAWFQFRLCPECKQAKLQKVGWEFSLSGYVDIFKCPNCGYKKYKADMFSMI